VVLRRLVAGALILAVPIALCIAYRPDRAIRVATGLVAHDICSKTFVSGLDPQTVLAETTDRAGISLLRWGLDYRLDRTGQTVDASLGGLLGSRAAFHEGFECVLLHGPDEPYLLKSDIAGGPEQALAFAWRELFNPLGMRNVTLEFDGAGTLQGSSYMLASARDWARFGLLYLNDGAIGGRRILHEDWVDFSAAATLDTDYGAGFWTNRSENENAKARVSLGIPRNAFFCIRRSRPAHRYYSIAASGDRPSRRLRRSHRRYPRPRTPGQGSDRIHAALSRDEEWRRCASARPYTARPSPMRACKPGGRECVPDRPSPWGDPARVLRAPQRPRAESSSGRRRR